MTIDAELSVVRKVGTEIQEERPEIFIDAIEVIMVDHRRGVHNPRVGRPGVIGSTTHSAHHPDPFLGLADRHNAIGVVSPAQIALRDVILALALLERDQIDALARNEILDFLDERVCHRRDGGGGRKALTFVNVQIAHDPPTDCNCGI